MQVLADRNMYIMYLLKGECHSQMFKTFHPMPILN